MSSSEYWIARRSLVIGLAEGETRWRAMTTESVDTPQIDEQKKACPAKPGALRFRRSLQRPTHSVEYLNSGIAFSSSLVALYTA
jgi:hypothetical protein